MKTVIKLVNGGVAVMTVIGDADVDECIEKWKSVNPGLYVSHREMQDEAIPTDRQFRAAWSDTTSEPVIDIDPAHAKEILLRDSDLLAKQKRDAIVADVSPAEMASWPLKLAEANKFTETAQAPDAPKLSIEAAARGVTLAVLVDKVLANAAALSSLEANIAGANGKHNDAIKQLDTVDSLTAYDLNAGWPV